MDDLLASQVCTALMRIGTRLASGFDQHFAVLGLTQAQFRVLLAIWELGGNDGSAPSVLADHLLIERGTVSVITNRMVEQGWLERVPGVNRRTYRLVLTTTGADLLQRAIPRAIALADATLSCISRDDLENVRAALDAVEAWLRTKESQEENNVP